MNTAKAYNTIIDALQHATAGDRQDPSKYREALKTAMTLREHYVERDEQVASTLMRCESLFYNMQSDLLMRGPEIDSVVELTEELEEATGRQRMILTLESRATYRDHGPDVIVGHGEPPAGPAWLVPVYIWGRDCDNCESSRITWIEPDLEVFNQLVADVYDSAEGLTAIRVLTPEEAADFTPSFRDRNLEAFENGRGTSCIV
jgi:hypothetical protein